MNSSVLIADVGDVLIRTRAGAHHHALAQLTGLSASTVEARIESDGLDRGFERGTVSSGTFAEWVRSRLAAPYLSDMAVRDAWNTVVAEPVPSIVGAAALLGAAARLVLASNTNPWHWPMVRDRLEAAGLPASVIVVLSFEVGSAKPDAGFFDALLQYIREPSSALFVDDRSRNVRQARAHGLDGWIHTDIDVTATRIRELAADCQRT